MTRQIGHSAFRMPSSAAAPVRATGCFQYTTERTAAITAAAAHALKPGIFSPARATISHRIGSIASRKFSTNISPLLLLDPGAYGPLYKVFLRLALPFGTTNLLLTIHLRERLSQENSVDSHLFVKSSRRQLCIFTSALSSRKCPATDIIPKKASDFFLFISFCTFFVLFYLYLSMYSKCRRSPRRPFSRFPSAIPSARSRWDISSSFLDSIP